MVMTRDPLSSKQGYSAKSYIQALEQDLLLDYTPGTFFQQDNARIHAAKVTRAWLEEHGIWTIDWPAHSPDLNPIEHVWAKMKDILHRNRPDLCYLQDNKLDWAEFERELQKAWREVPQPYIDDLIDSMARRLEAVRLAKGWYTKY